MDYMVQLAQSLLRLREKTRQELWVTVERCIGQSQADLDRWRSVDDAGRVELLADVLYRFPTDVAVLAAEAVGYPVFLKGLLERLVEFASEDTRPVRRTFNHLIHAHLVERDELKKALPADVADVISPLLRPPRTRLRRSLARVAALMAPLRRLFRRRSMPDAPVESESLDRGSIEKKALRLLLERPALVCRLAEVLQMAV